MDKLQYFTAENVIKIIIHQMRQSNMLGRGDFDGSVGKGKQTRFYFRPEHSHFSSMF
jgi:hypothetical protein